jgi:hypothetical protein
MHVEIEGEKREREPCRRCMSFSRRSRLVQVFQNERREEFVHDDTANFWSLMVGRFLSFGSRRRKEERDIVWLMIGF